MVERIRIVRPDRTEESNRHLIAKRSPLGHGDTVHLNHEILITDAEFRLPASAGDKSHCDTNGEAFQKQLVDIHEFHGRRYFIKLESEIDERTEIGSIQGGDAEDEGKDGDAAYQDMLTVVVLSVIDLVLDSQADSRERAEREEGCHQHRH